MNKVMLIGNVGKEPDVRYYDADQAVAQVTFATTEKGYTLAMARRFPIVPSGIPLCSIALLPR